MFRSRKEMQSLIDSSRKSLAEAELQIAERNKLIKNEIAEKEQLKSKIKDIQNTLEYWKDKFEKLISFLHSKLHSWYDKDDKYIDVVNDMYEDNVLDDDDDIEDLDLKKSKDDFERKGISMLKVAKIWYNLFIRRVYLWI